MNAMFGAEFLADEDQVFRGGDVVVNRFRSTPVVLRVMPDPIVIDTWNSGA